MISVKLFYNKILSSNFYLDNNLAGDERITHLKDRMRECQKVFFNLKTALIKIEKQRRGFLRKQKPILTPTPSKFPLASSFKSNSFSFSYSNNNYRNVRNINMYINLCSYIYIFVVLCNHFFSTLNILQCIIYHKCIHNVYLYDLFFLSRINKIKYDFIRLLKVFEEILYKN